MGYDYIQRTKDALKKQYQEEFGEGFDIDEALKRDFGQEPIPSPIEELQTLQKQLQFANEKYYQATEEAHYYKVAFNMLVKEIVSLCEKSKDE